MTGGTTNEHLEGLPNQQRELYCNAVTIHLPGRNTTTIYLGEDSSSPNRLSRNSPLMSLSLVK